MKTWICSTMASFFGPQQGAARLYAYIKNQGHEISFKDLNQESYFSLLSREYLEPVMELLKINVDPISRNRFTLKDAGAILLHSSSDATRQLAAKGILLNHPPVRFAGNSGIARKLLFRLIGSRIKPDNIYYAVLSEQDFVLSEIEKARNVLYQRFYELPTEDFLRNFYTLLCGKALIDAVYFPAQIDFGLGFCGTAFNPTTGDILRAVKDERYNYLIPYYRKAIIPEFFKEQPEVVGISITHMSEFIPAFTLAHLIKSARPETHVTLGGSTVSEVAYRIVKNPPLWSLFDSLIIGPGEYAFSELLERIEKRADLAGVPNLTYKEKDSIKKSEKLQEFDINDACTPEYVSLRPKSGLPLETASGCYWGKCIFCFYPRHGSANSSPQYQKKRVRNIELVLEDVRKLQEKYDPVAIGFTDSAMPPRRIEQIAEENLKNGGKVKFFSFIRFEKEFKSDAFCRKLAAGGFLGGQVGLESGSQRINDIINKGVDIRDAELIVQSLHKAGILIHIYSIVGIPGEKLEDSAMTYRFIKRWHKKISLDWQIYPLFVWEQSALAERAEEFGLTATPLPDDFLIQLMMHRVREGISQEQSVSLAIHYYEELKRYMHPLIQIVDIESLKQLLMVQKAKGVSPDKVKLPRVRV